MSELVNINLSIGGNDYSITCEMQDKDVLIDISKKMDYELRQMNSMQMSQPDEGRRIMLVALNMLLELSKEMEKLGKDNFTINQINSKLRSSLDIALSEN